MKLGARLGQAFDRTLNFLAWLACLLILFQVVSVSTEVMVRYFFGISFGWVTSLNEWSLVFLTFLGVAWLQREGGHTSDDSIIQLLPGWVKVAAGHVATVLALLTCGMLTWYGAKVTWQNYANNTYDFFKIREVPVFVIYAIIPIGSFLWLLQLLRSLRSKQDDNNSKTPLGGSDL